MSDHGLTTEKQKIIQNENKADKSGIEALVSVIIPVYNVENDLRRCLETIFIQTYKNIEIILIDDGSTDNSGHMCDEFSKKDKRCKVYHTENYGLSAARNYGIEHSHGEYIVFVDSDDYVDIDYVEYLQKLICEYKTDMSICQHRVCYEDGTIKDCGKSMRAEAMSDKECIGKMLYHNVIDTSAWAKMYKKELFDDVRYPDGKLFEDIATTYKCMIKAKQIAVGYKAKYNYIIRGNSIVNCDFNIRKLDLLEMTDKMGSELLNCYPDLSGGVLRRRVYARISTLNQMVGVSGYYKQRYSLLSFISENKEKVLTNKKAPKRDKIAILLICMDYRLYCMGLKLYKRIKGKINF